MEEIYKVIPFADKYEVSNLGNVRVLKTKYVMKLFTGRGGYIQVSLTRKNKPSKTFTIHRLVALVFLKKPKEYNQVNHIDGVKSNNQLSNLEWCNALQNMTHAYKLGLVKSSKGAKNGMSKLTELEVVEILQLMKMGLTTTEISQIFNVSPQQINRIKVGKYWKHILRS
jgi:hypothetical protein